ncbi:Pimeloyl-ACP methyl ester carboxylesterase [Streptomyces sp. DvalAA-14]|uniref:alpha/beta fold hydrolase n=1 Tax=unclassified Streptomyces TaxID=2593676 RepID=UPI00081BAE03|nr:MULTISPECIES: alpha/beta hydrolase [unclassified Streptomyces]MYS21785.1 alpha/beta fold hydrolase [Streptomyces sp. SID4948]SCE01219.1 Pimeloyl-ACP methyl ester carboxylesterase [Streptomyces sp. DvalAA-14]
MATATRTREHPPTHFRTEEIDGLNIFYREAGPSDAPAVVLLHGFPTSSRMYRNLIPQLSDAYHVIAPDYPGFGHSDAPDRDDFTYTFDHVADIMEKLLDRLKVRKYTLYMMDFGGPIGWRLAVRHPERVSALVLQNAPLYPERDKDGFWKDMIPYWSDGSDEHRNVAKSFVSPDSTRDQYLIGTRDPSLVDPDNWLTDQALLDRPGVDEIMMDYLYDISKLDNLFAAAKEFLRTEQPPALIATGANDIVFSGANMRNFLHELPNAEFHALDTGHFALEEKADEIGGLMRSFLDRTVSEG